MTILGALFASEVPQTIEGTLILLKDGVPVVAVDNEYGCNVVVYSGDELTDYLHYLGVGHRELEDTEYVCGGAHMHTPVWTSVFLEA
jgi:hypothetical protein